MITRTFGAMAVLAAALLPSGPAWAVDGITAAVRGTVQYDLVALASADLPPGETVSTGGNFRRIRLGVGGRIGENWGYEFSARVEQASLERLPIANAYLQYDGFGPLHFRIGAFNPPGTLEDATVTADMLFLERAQPAELARGIAGGTGRSGAAAFAYDDSYFASVSYTGGLFSDAIARQQAVVGRAVWRPWHDGASGVAIGADLSHVFSPPRSGATHDVRLRARPELNTQVVDMRLIDTGPMDTDSLTEFGVEAVGNFGNLFAQGGFFRYAVDRIASADPVFGGWYLQGSWILTGETRVWRSNRGGYGAPAPTKPLGEGGFGALELAARYSELDLDEQAGLPGTPRGANAVRGGRQQIATIGLNWYPTQNVRLMLNYQHVTVARLSGAGGDIGARMDLLSLRTQFAF